MKRLTLVRHAQAEAAGHDQSDFERLLTRRGMEDASEMARRFKARKLVVDCILSSTAPRAFATAEIFARALKVADSIEQDDRLYTAGPKEFLSVLHQLNSTHGHILVTAHNPGISEFADKLSNERRIEGMPTCAVLTMQFAITSWADLQWDSGIDVELDNPGRQT